eukprot:UN24871
MQKKLNKFASFCTGKYFSHPESGVFVMFIPVAQTILCETCFSTTKANAKFCFCLKIFHLKQEEE